MAEGGSTFFSRAAASKVGVNRCVRYELGAPHHGQN